MRAAGRVRTSGGGDEVCGRGGGLACARSAQEAPDHRRPPDAKTPIARPPTESNPTACTSPLSRPSIADRSSAINSSQCRALGTPARCVRRARSLATRAGRAFSARRAGRIHQQPPLAKPSESCCRSFHNSTSLLEPVLPPPPNPCAAPPTPAAASSLTRDWTDYSGGEDQRSALEPK